MARINIAIRDYGGELGRMTLPVEQPTEIAGEGSIANYYPTIEAALEAIILGVVAASSFSINEQEDATEPTSKFAQRELGVRLYLSGDEDARNFTLTVPTPDLNVLTLEGEDDVKLDDGGVMAALVAALEANLAYPSVGASDTQSVTITRARVVGRNS